MGLLRRIESVGRYLTNNIFTTSAIDFSARKITREIAPALWRHALHPNEALLGDALSESQKYLAAPVDDVITCMMDGPDYPSRIQQWWQNLHEIGLSDIAKDVTIILKKGRL